MDESETQQPLPEGQTQDDERFEVKWRKKNESTPTPSANVDSGAQEVHTPTPDEAASLRQELEAAEQRVRELQERWHRAQADLANLRRRTEEERGETEKFASMMLVAELLPVLDNFERALSTIPGNLSMLTWIQGVVLIERHLRAILEHRGIAPIEAENQAFSPHLHEAIAERETSDSIPGTVVQVYQRGYTMHGRVLRPSLVELAKAPTTSTDTSELGVTDDAAAQEVADEAGTQNAGP
ncbi:MAG: nucleotide exchange factor GrpE [Chloroflexota bacterium]